MKLVSISYGQFRQGHKGRRSGSLLHYLVNQNYNFFLGGVTDCSLAVIKTVAWRPCLISVNYIKRQMMDSTYILHTYVAGISEGDRDHLRVTVTSWGTCQIL